ISQGRKIGAAVTVDGPFWVTGGSRRVEEAQGLPFVPRFHDGEIGVALGEESLIADAADRWRGLACPVHGDDDDGMIDIAQRLRGETRVLTIDDEDLGGAVVQRKGDGRRVEARV